MTAKLKPPIYTLPHGIEVIGEYGITDKNRYTRVRIRPHKFFPGLRVVSGGCYIRRSRAVMASVLGRELCPREVVHHINENREDDRPENLEIITGSEHNTHHKTGHKHRPESKQKTATSLRKAYAEGRKQKPQILRRNHRGQIQ